MAKKKTTKRIASVKEIEGAIHFIRGQRVMLDADLAVLYGVTTKQLNQQVARNQERFPKDFAYQLTSQEFTTLKSQFVTSKPTGRGGRRYLLFDFTEQGVAMLSSVLKSPTAVRVNIEIMLAFVRMRQLMATPGELVEQITKLKDTVPIARWPNSSNSPGAAADDGKADDSSAANWLSCRPGIEVTGYSPRTRAFLMASRNLVCVRIMCAFARSNVHLV